MMVFRWAVATMMALMLTGAVVCAQPGGWIKTWYEHMLEIERLRATAPRSSIHSLRGSKNSTVATCWTGCLHRRSLRGDRNSQVFGKGTRSISTNACDRSHV